MISNVNFHLLKDFFKFLKEVMGFRVNLSVLFSTTMQKWRFLILSLRPSAILHF